MSNTEFDPAAVARRIAENDAADLFVLDVRNEDDYEEWRIDGSTNVPIYDELLECDYSTLEGHLTSSPERHGDRGRLRRRHHVGAGRGVPP